MWYLWLGIVILLTIVEVMTSGLVTIWFVISGIVALLLSFIIDNFVIQFSVFVVLGIFLLVKTRSILEKKLITVKQKTNLDRIVGMTGIVTDDIDKNCIGEVKVDGKYWSAIAEEYIPKESVVKILEINGVKVKVKKVEE